MKVGIGASTDVQATVDRCKQLGVDCVFISCASLPGYQENGYPDPDSLREFKGRLKEKGVEVPSATYGFAKWPSRPWIRSGSTNPDILLSRDRRCIDAMLRMIEILGEVGITSVLHYVDIGKPQDAAKVEACWEGLIDIYRELIPVAEASGVGIGNHSLHRLLPDGIREQAIAAGARVEDYNSYTADGWGGPFLVGTPEELSRLVSAVKSPCNGVTLCTGMDIVGGDVPTLVKAFAGNIHFCQFRDHSERWPAGQEVPLGEGRVNFSAIAAALRETGYQGVVHPEHLGKPRYPDEDLVAKAVAYIKSL
jgi:sugar phosphate isomerase/epimerase